MNISSLTTQDINRIIEMAWEDRTPFEAIFFQFGITESEVIVLMRNNLKNKSWRLWRERVTNRSTKHLGLRSFKTGRHKSKMQRLITSNKISKR
jgi:uncharacterized protein (TIGR03643 family)